ncbi:hypothetical protein ASD15_11570 [Massilia sp. Root351]|jgi:hypothetical protein|uniref:hypothetical protein n=1 Tax=Massilia sp. Root351 TaxID=1736522 RepID=UPI00070B0271|nr:hypothetical protein [Massilia sp. Root351]KQV80583.1 hypothetical protein ASD15_11570 [Massilia sp. Root351]
MQGKSDYTNGKRFAIVLACSILSSLALTGTVLVAAAVFLGQSGSKAVTLAKHRFPVLAGQDGRSRLVPRKQGGRGLRNTCRNMQT